MEFKGVREVWGKNFYTEYQRMRNHLQKIKTLGPPVIAMDTEFPGIVHESEIHYSDLQPSEYYNYMRHNVEDTKLIQLGLTIADAHGNQEQTWQFNFYDFDPEIDLYAQSSIDLLKNSGIDFEKNKMEGISSKESAARYLVQSGILGPRLRWVTFSGTFDYGYLMKLILSAQTHGGNMSLPLNFQVYLNLSIHYFGAEVYNLKHMKRPKFINGVELFRGLESLAKNLGVQRSAGRAQESGSDSLLTLHTFLQMEKLFFLGGLRKEVTGFLVGDKVFGRITPPPRLMMVPPYPMMAHHPYHPMMIRPSSPVMFHPCNLHKRFPTPFQPIVAAHTTLPCPIAF